jgi:hypothetical protein
VSLEKWAEYGWLKPEPTSRDEIRSLLSIVERDLRDANGAGLPEDRRCEAAFTRLGPRPLRYGHRAIVLPSKLDTILRPLSLSN